MKVYGNIQDDTCHSNIDIDILDGVRDSTELEIKELAHINAATEKTVTVVIVILQVVEYQ